MTRPVPRQEQEIERWPGHENPDWDAIDEASWESFPASDPPATRTPTRRSIPVPRRRGEPR